MPATGDLLDRDGLDEAHVEIVGYPNIGLFITLVKKGFNRDHLRASFFVKPEYLWLHLKRNKGMASQTDRINFTEATKEVIRRRAGYRCCKCDKTLVGPGTTTNDFVELGECAHIYVAKPTGPRGQSHLTEEQLKSPENGRHLCNDCHELVDGKLREKKYRAEKLLQIKAIHEYKIAVEIGNDVIPLNWIKSVKIEENPNIKVESIIDFAKATILYGSNGTGKLSIIEMLYEVLSSSILKRWSGNRMKAVIDVDNPVNYPVTMTLDRTYPIKRVVVAWLFSLIRWMWYICEIRKAQLR